MNTSGNTTQNSAAQPVAGSDAQHEATHRRPWVEPTLENLPKLTDLTLQTGIGIGGGTGVFP